METLDITAVAKATGLTSRALRFYEARGLVTPLRASSGRRYYGPGELARLNAVVALKRAGFTLSVIAGMLAGRSANLGKLVAAQLLEIDLRATELADTRALLLTVQSCIDRREPIDVAPLCSLIQKGNTIMEHQNWKSVSERYLGDDAIADFATQMPQMPAGFDHAAHTAKWDDLVSRIEAALPLHPTTAEAGRLYDEWQSLLAPFTAVATPAMMSGVSKMYDNIDDWKGEQKPPFSAAVWQFIQAVGATRQ
jgi:MerR family transcriptional regulator, thiopeptide resistance regulator